MSWRQRLDQEPSLRSFSEWPAIDYSLIPPERRSVFLRNRRVVSKVLAGHTLRDVAQSDGLSTGRVSQLLERCLGGNLDEPPFLTEGLLPYVQVTPPKRISPLPTLQANSACTGAFNQLLSELPELKQELDRAIDADFRRQAVSERLTAASLHKRFLFKLAALNWPLDCYPYTTSSRGYESVRRYWLLRRQGLKHATYRDQNAVPAESPSPQTFRALSTIQIDEHLMDVHSRISMELGGELIHMRLSRCTLMLAIDVGTQCVLGFNLVPTAASNQQDMLELLERCLNQRNPRRFTTPQFHAPEGPTFPAEVAPPLALSFGTVLFDNAWMHHSNSVVNFLTNTMGAGVRFGYPALPKSRALVERVFNFVEQRLGHRFDSTTGSSPTDSVKESRKNAKLPPMVTFQTLEEALYLTLHEFNHRRRPHLGGSSPMALFRHHLQTHWVRYFAEAQSEEYRPLLSQKRLIVHRPQPGGGTPYVYLEYCRYRGPGLVSLPPRQSHVIVEYDRRDIRAVRAKSIKGEELGDLQAPQSWQRFPHSVSTRRLLFKQKRVYRDDQHDPLSGYFSDLLEHREKPKVASQILRIYQDMASGGHLDFSIHPEQPPSLNPELPVESDNAPRPEMETEHRFKWSPMTTSVREGDQS